MPYTIDGNCVKKKDGETVKCHDSHEKAVAHLRALEANVKDSALVEMSLRITKASYNKSEDAPRKWTAIDSDIDEDLYAEKMSIDLYKDFVYRIESNTSIPEAFRSVICEDDWCGGMPYLSIAHYKAGSGLKNVPGMVDSLFIDGTRLKSKGTLSDTSMGRKVFDALVEDLYKKKSGDNEHKPVRISIGFLDLEHKHLSQAGGQEFTFTRERVGQICPLCAQGIGGKIYCKGQLIHLAMTRVPVNPRTEMVAEKSMDEITTKKQDAESIIGELANELEEKSIASDILVVRSDDNGSTPTPDPSELTTCYDPNTGGWDNACIASVMEKYMPDIRNAIGVPVKSETMPKGLLDVVIAQIYKSNGYDVPVMEDAMEELNVEKNVAGVPVKPFSHTQFGVTVTGEGPKEVTAPVKAESKDGEELKEDEKKEHMKEMSVAEKAFKSLMENVQNKNAEEVQKAFAELGAEVEKAFAPEPKPFDPADLAAIVKSAVEEVVAPLRIELATLKASAQGAAVTSDGVVKSKALSLNPGGQKIEDLVKRGGYANVPAQPTRKLSQIEMLARRSTGLQDQ